MKVSRREFLGTSATAVIVAGTMAQGKVFGANDRIRVAVAGINDQGNEHIEAFAKAPGAEVAALCDVDKNVLAKRADEVQTTTGKRPQTYVDMRDIMADESIDAVSFATPNHWHALGTIWACQAGKDVYVEKPLSHELWEGRQMIAAAKKYGRIVQHGTQRRSFPEFRREIDLLHQGIIGDIYMARGVVYKTGRRGPMGFAPPEEPPDRLDWTLWQGPAPERPYCKNYVHYKWHWFWHYGNGELGNQGAHQMDIATWGLNKGLPVKVSSIGGRFTYEDQGETPNTQVANFAYADGTMLVLEVRNRFTNAEGGLKVGNMFYGSEGYCVVEKGFFDKQSKRMDTSSESQESEKGRQDAHFKNFLTAVRSRKPEDVRATVEDGHVACVHCHLGNISYRLGRSLEFDPKTERFVNDPEADAMLRREYREGFEVPELA